MKRIWRRKEQEFGFIHAKFEVLGGTESACAKKHTHIKAPGEASEIDNKI